MLRLIPRQRSEDHCHSGFVGRMRAVELTLLDPQHTKQFQESSHARKLDPKPSDEGPSGCEWGEAR